MMFTDEQRYMYLFYNAVCVALMQMLGEEEPNDRLMLAAYESALETYETMSDEKLKLLKRKYDKIDQLYLEKLKSNRRAERERIRDARVIVHSHYCDDSNRH